MPEELTLEQRFVKHAQITAAAIAKATEFQKAAQAKQAACNAMIPKVVEAMVRGGRIEPEQRNDLAAALTDPVKTLDLLAKTAMHRNADEQEAELRLGHPGGQHTVKEAETRKPYIGERTSTEPDSFKKFAAAFLPDLVPSA